MASTQKQKTAIWGVIERTFGWLIRYWCPAHDYEGLPSRREALLQMASIRLFLTRLAPFRYSFLLFQHTLMRCCRPAASEKRRVLSVYRKRIHPVVDW